MKCMVLTARCLDPPTEAMGYISVVTGGSSCESRVPCRSSLLVGNSEGRPGNPPRSRVPAPSSCPMQLSMHERKVA